MSHNIQSSQSECACDMTVFRPARLAFTELQSSDQLKPGCRLVFTELQSWDQ